ncbi:hypothetical protein Hanom_Chr16g01418201 [Helianthus anomalus]
MMRCSCLDAISSRVFCMISSDLHRLQFDSLSGCCSNRRPLILENFFCGILLIFWWLKVVCERDEESVCV